MKILIILCAAAALISVNAQGTVDCSNVLCTGGMVCDPSVGCVPADNLCTNVRCEPGQRCFRSDGQCHPDPCGNVTCDDGFRCFASTGQCARNPCSTIICPQEYPICHTIDAVNAICVADACEGVMCGAGQRCLQSTGRCSPGCSDPTPLQNRGIGTSPFRRLIWDSWDAKLNFTRQWFQLNVTGPTDISGFSVTVNDSAISDANCVDVQLFTKCDATSEVVAAPKKRIVYNSAEIVFHFGGQLERNGGNLFVFVDVNACDAGLFAPLRMSTLTHKTHCVYKKISASPINY
eukprot:261373_1